MVHWTGHPLVDVGLATLCAMANKKDAQDLTNDDLDGAAEEMAEYFFSGSMNSYLTCVFMNSAYVQPAMGKKEKAEYAKRVLYAHRWPGDEAAKGLRCSFSGEPATHLIHRGQMPMLTGEDVLNFFPHGRGGLPVAGPYLVALQALPLGSRRTEGRLLAAYCDEPSVLVALAKRYLSDNRRLMELATSKKLPKGEGPFVELIREQGAFDKQKKIPKYPDAKAPTSLIAVDLMEIYQARGPYDPQRQLASMSVYWLSSSGQGPSLEIFHIPSQAVRFLLLAASAPTASNWKHLVAEAWRQPEDKSVAARAASVKKTKAKSAQATVPGAPGRSRNDVLADLFAVFEEGFIDRSMAHRFLQRHVLRLARYRFRRATAGDTGTQEPRPRIDHAEWIDWSLTKLFVKEIMGMEEKRVEAIREFADKMADYVFRSKDKDVFRSLVYGQKSWEIRNALTKAQRNRAREHDELLFGLDEYLEVFIADDAVGKADWSLIRDLISIRLVEQLYQKGFFKKEENQDLLVEPETETPASV
jgi:CRISPR-associated protein Cst1